MSKLQELLVSFPEYWQTGDEGVPVLSLVYHGVSCPVKIVDDVLEIRPSGSPRMVVSLDQIKYDTLTHIPYMMKLSELATQLRTIPNLDVTIIEESFRFFNDGTMGNADLANVWRTYPNIWTNYPLPVAPQNTGWWLNEGGNNRPLMVPGPPTSTGDLGAVVLTDCNQDVVRDHYLTAPTNLLWNLLKPIARGLRQAESYGSSLLRQMDLRTVEGPWLDRWGEIYGVKRIFPEDDISYRRRLAATVFRPRLAPNSLESALVNGFGFNDAAVSDSSPVVLGGVSYSFTTAPFKFLVNFSARPEQAHYFGGPTSHLVDIYRAAGTTYQQIGVVQPVPEIIPKPLQTFRMQKQYVNGKIDAYAVFEDGPWQRDAGIATTPPVGSPSSLFGGKRFGESLFG